MRIAHQLFPGMVWKCNKSYTDGGYFKYVMTVPLDGHMGDELKACLRMPNDTFCRRYYTHSEIKYQDGSKGRLHDCTAIVLDSDERPITVTWRNKSIKQVLPNMEEVSIDQGMLTVSFFVTCGQEQDTTEDCAPIGDIPSDDLVLAVESLEEQVMELTKKLKLSQGRHRALRAQLLRAGLVPTSKTMTSAQYIATAPEKTIKKRRAK